MKASVKTEVTVEKKSTVEEQKTTKRIPSEQELLNYLGAFRNREVPATGLSKVIGTLIPQQLRPHVRIVATDAIRFFARKKAAKMVDAPPLRLNLGCGALPMKGWVNVDLVGLPVDLAWNITRKLPFPDNSVDAIFHEHVQEHLTSYDGYHFMKDCYRVLRPGGVLRIVMPDARRYMESYLNDPKHEFLNSWKGERPTPMMNVQDEFWGFSHKALYDYDTVELFGKVVGFSEVESMEFGRSRISPCPDSEWRITDSFYSEMVK